VRPNVFPRNVLAQCMAVCAATRRNRSRGHRSLSDQLGFSVDTVELSRLLVLPAAMYNPRHEGHNTWSLVSCFEFVWANSVLLVQGCSLGRIERNLTSKMDGLEIDLRQQNDTLRQEMGKEIWRVSRARSAES